MSSILISETTREEREQIVAESIGNISGLCDGCSAGLAEMYQDYIDGKREIREINMEFRAGMNPGQARPKRAAADTRGRMIMMLEKMGEFFDARLDGYEEHQLSCIESAAEFYPFTAACLPQTPGTRLLDLGCGTGLELSYYFETVPTARVTGIDLAPGMLEALREKYPDKDMTLIRGSYFDVPFGENIFDAAVSVESLHHFTKAEKTPLYEKIRRALKPGGYFILTDYFAMSEEEEQARRAELLRLKKEQGLADDEFYHYDTPLTVAHEIEALTDAGFASVTVLKNWGHTYTIKGVVCCCGKEKHMKPEPEIIALPKEQWKGTIVPLVTRSDSYYDFSIDPLDYDGCTIRIERKKAEEEIVHTPEEYDFPDTLYADYRDKAEAYGVVSDDGELLACIEVCVEEWSNRMIVSELWVSEGLRGQHVGKRLMDKAKEIAAAQGRRAIMLETQSCNTKAIGFYLRQGFEIFGFDTCCYANNDIARREVRINLGYYL